MITQRFIRAPHIFTDPVPRQPMPKSDNPTYLFGNKVRPSPAELCALTHLVCSPWSAASCRNWI